MRWRQIVLLYLVAGALALEYAVVEPRRPGIEVAAPPARARFLPLGPDEVTEVRVERGGRPVMLRRDGERWRVVEPEGAQVPSDLVRAFVEALAGADEIDRVAAVPTDVEPFGLDEGATRVTLVGGSGEPTVVLLGRTNPTGTALYARRLGSAGVVLIGRNVRYYEDLIYDALPQPVVPLDAGEGTVGSGRPLTTNRRAV